MSGFLFRGHRYEVNGVEFQAVLGAAYATRERPVCPCTGSGVAMCVARLGARFILRRMPGSGSLHHPSCVSYEAAASASEGQIPSILEDAATGQTLVRVDLGPVDSRLSRTSNTRRSRSPRLSKPLAFRHLLLYLWDRAELNTWHPSFAGKRSWATVRTRLLRAAEGMLVNGSALAGRLYVPERFVPQRSTEIAARRIACWSSSSAARDRPQVPMLLIGELKELCPMRVGACVRIKHVPDTVFAMTTELYLAVSRRYADELREWSRSPDLRILAIATFVVRRRAGQI